MAGVVDYDNKTLFWTGSGAWIKAKMVSKDRMEWVYLGPPEKAVAARGMLVREKAKAAKGQPKQ